MDRDMIETYCNKHFDPEVEKYQNQRVFLVGAAGFEPATPWSQTLWPI